MTKGHCESSLGSFDELQNSAQAAVDPLTKPPDLGCESACRQLSSTTTIAIYITFFNLPRPATAILLLRNASDLRNCTSYFGACMWVWYCIGLQ